MKTTSEIVQVSNKQLLYSLSFTQYFTIPDYRPRSPTELREYTERNYLFQVLSTGEADQVQFHTLPIINLKHCDTD